MLMRSFHSRPQMAEQRRPAASRHHRLVARPRAASEVILSIKRKFTANAYVLIVLVIAWRLLQPPIDQPGKKDESPKDAVEKYGLEAGLFKVLTGPQDEKEGKPAVSRTDQAKALLAQYGSAYLVTSISFAAVSFAICYAAVNSGVDMGALLAKIGLQVNDTSETVGTFAIAYAAHKALSPIRFPPTVALTPIVAKWFGKK